MAPRGRGPAGLDRGGRAEANSSLRERLRDYESLLESLGGIVWEADPETLRFRFVSRQAERLLGYPVELWLKTPNFWIDHVHPDDRAWVPDFCRDATAAHRSHELDYRMIAADGSVVWLRDIVTVVIEEGRPVSCRGVMIDIRERKRAEAELRVATERLRTLVHNAPVILFGVDRHGTVELCEGKGLEAAGIDPSEIVGRHFDDWPRSTSETQQNIRRALAGEDFTATVSFEDRTYVTRYAPIRAPRGGTDGVMGVATDVTERVRAEADRMRLEAQVQHAQRLESLGVLAGGIAHDFNNLLTTILGSASLALEDLPVGLPARANVERVQRAAESAANLTNRLLAYAGHNHFHVRTVDFSTLVGGISDLLRVSVSKKAVLGSDLADGLPPVDCDAAQLTQVVMNLITNASEALGDESGAITLRTGLVHLDAGRPADAYPNGACEAGPHVFLEVADTGSGMDDDTLTRIFDPFFTTKLPGRGLGLAVVLGIVRGHRGAVRVTSEAGRGTTVRILLPCAKGPHAHAQRAARRDPVRRFDGTALVADDEPGVREVAGAFLERLGLRVIEACDGREAARVFAERADEIAVVLMDMTMPNADGAEAVAEIRRLRRDIPLVVMSGHSEEAALSRFGEGAPAAFLSKPFDREALAAALARVLRSRTPGRARPDAGAARRPAPS